MKEPDMPASRTPFRLGRATILCIAAIAVFPLPSLAEAAAPSPPTGIFVDQGPGWRSDNHFDVWWNTPPDQVTPIAVAHYELCPAVPLGPCVAYQVAGDNISELDVSVPHAGWFWMRVWLEDELGSVNPNAKSSQVMLRYDDGVPPEASLRHDDAWLNESAPTNPSYIIEIGADAEWPMSGIRGYSVTVNGDLPDGDVEVLADQDNARFQALYEMDGLHEGTSIIRLRSVSNAGVPSPDVGLAEVRVDRTPPILLDGSVTLAANWYRDSLVIPLEAKDQPQLSGMVPAPEGQPVENGARIAYKLDGGTTRALRGAQGLVPVTTDGVHTITYRAFDAAGNASVEKEAVVRIDGTAPVGAFRALDPEDPRMLRVDVADATSGVADGWIEYRKEGEGGFKRLATVVGSGALSGRMEDEGKPAGRYEVRAVVTDVAGNEAVIDSWADGSAMRLDMPLRLGALLEVVGTSKAKRCAKPAKKGRTKARRKRSHRQRCQSVPKARKSLELRFGKRIASDGTLTTSQGVPIVGAAVLVEGQPRSGGAFVRLGTAKTNAQGKFRFTIPSGPSRTVRYRYDGTNTIRSGTAELTTRVRAAARLNVDRRRLRNGQVVRFRGKLLGGPIPAVGKLVALQAKVGRRWRTFANPRANAKGVFRHRYRFTSTTGLRRYRFRAIVAREAAYPYEAGMSPTIRVTVRGR